MQVFCLVSCTRCRLSCTALFTVSVHGQQEAALGLPYPQMSCAQLSGPALTATHVPLRNPASMSIMCKPPVIRPVWPFAAFLTPPCLTYPCMTCSTGGHHVQRLLVTRHSQNESTPSACVDSCFEGQQCHVATTLCASTSKTLSKQKYVVPCCTNVRSGCDDDRVQGLWHRSR